MSFQQICSSFRASVRLELSEETYGVCALALIKNIVGGLQSTTFMLDISWIGFLM